MESDVQVDGSCTQENNEPGNHDKSTVDKIRKRRSSIFHSRTATLFEEFGCTECTASRDETVANPPVNPADRVIPTGNNTIEKQIEVQSCLLASPLAPPLDPPEGTFDLEGYIEKLKEERRGWQSKLKERKNKRRNLLKEKANHMVESYEIELKLVSSKKERAFFLARPKYEYLTDQLNKLSREASAVANLNRIVSKLNRRFILNFRRLLLCSTKRMIEMDQMSSAL